MRCWSIREKMRNEKILECMKLKYLFYLIKNIQSMKQIRQTENLCDDPLSNKRREQPISTQTRSQQSSNHKRQINLNSLVKQQGRNRMRQEGND